MTKLFTNKKVLTGIEQSIKDRLETAQNYKANELHFLIASTDTAIAKLKTQCEKMGHHYTIIRDGYGQDMLECQLCKDELGRYCKKSPTKVCEFEEVDNGEDYCCWDYLCKYCKRKTSYEERNSK